MKPNFIFSIISLNALFIGCCLLFSIQASGNSQTKSVQFVSGTQNESTIKFTVSDFAKEVVVTPWGEMVSVKCNEATPILKQGAPDVPKFIASIIIPDRAKMEVQVLSSIYTDYPNIEVAPSKGSFSRSINPKDVPYIKGEEYTQNKFFPSICAELRSPYIVRDYRGQTVVVYPFQYNPFTKTLRVYSEIVLSLVHVDNNGENIIQRTIMPSKINDEFAQMYKNQFLNGDVFLRSTPIEEHGNMLIICYGPFMNAMQPFIDWKRRTGMPVEMINIATIGNDTNSIKNYVRNYYNTKGLTFLLLVGDSAEITPMRFSDPDIPDYWGDSDNGYSYIVGNDRYSDILVGRFSAQSISHVITQATRVIRYEKYPHPGDTCYKNGIGIASVEGPGDNNEYDWQHIRNIRTRLMNYNYSSVKELYDGSQGESDSLGNPTPLMLSAAINNRVGVINYCGHGNKTMWSTTFFSNTEINDLTNTDAYPFIWSVACLNGEFSGDDTCFAETWLRATDNNGQPAGAIAALMSTIEQDWIPPMKGQDEMNSILTESYTNNIKRTFGGISVNGCLKMNDAYGAIGMYMTDTWILFGDPSVMVRTDIPLPMTVSHVATENIGVTQLTVSCNIQNAFVSLTLNGNILGIGVISSGSVTITFPAVNVIDTIDVTITAYNKIPYLGIVKIVYPVSASSCFGFDFEFSIYPNPFSENTVLQITPALDETNYELSIFNVFGQEVYPEIIHLNKSGFSQASNNSDRFTIRKGSLLQGVYFCRMKLGDATVTKKFVVTK
ncbi:MAG: C25 family cysteine peptidase [Bacteroidota bacterium]